MRWRDRAATVLAAGALAVLILAAGPATTLAASPEPTGAAAGDPRSEGEGAGLVGDPLFAIGGVALIALLTVGGTLLYVRATSARGSRPPG